MRGLAVLCLLPLVLASCSGAPKNKTRTGDTKTYEFDKVVSTGLRVRRTAGPGADPKAGPGGPDYTSQPAFPDATFDCQKPEALFPPQKVAEIRQCLASLREPIAAVYKLWRAPVPELRLVLSDEQPEVQKVETEVEEDKDKKDEKKSEGAKPSALPECVQRTLGTLPVPREVFFVGEVPVPDEEKKKKYECFATRLDIEAGQLLGARLPTARWEMPVTLPPDPPPADDAALSRLLVAWALTPVIRPEGAAEKTKARLVPETLCEECFGGKPPERTYPFPPQWP